MHLLDNFLRQVVRSHVLAHFVHDFLNVFALFIIAECDRDTVRTSSGCAAHSVQITLGLSWHLEIQHRFYVRNIETSRNQICSQQVVNFASLKLFNSDHSICLRHVSVDLGTLETEAAQ